MEELIITLQNIYGLTYAGARHEVERAGVKPLSEYLKLRIRTRRGLLSENNKRNIWEMCNEGKNHATV